MSETVDDLTVAYTEGGVETIKELDKFLLSKGAWATVIYRYQEWDEKNQIYGADKFTIRRYQKRNGEYRQKSKFNISSVAQAEKIVTALQQWTQEIQASTHIGDVEES